MPSANSQSATSQTPWPPAGVEWYYSDDHVAIAHGDCREILPLIEADVLVTDPPYGIGWTTHGVSRTARADRARGDFNGRQRPERKIVNDEDTLVRDQVLTAWGDRPAVVFGSLFVAPPAETRHVAIYVKPIDGGALSAFGTLRRDCEAVYLLGKRRDGWGEQVKTGRGAERAGRTPTKMRSSVFRTGARVIGTPAGIVARYGHPHAKPIDVVDALISECIPRRDWVICDPFLGSGSTLVAAKGLGRKAIGIELEERYCEIAAERCSQEVLDLGVAA